MSAGSFEVGKYADQNGNVWRCRVQPETKDLSIGGTANAYPAGSVTAGLPTLPVNISSRRQFGIKMRTVTIEMTADPTGAQGDYQGEGTRHTIQVFNPTVWAGYEAEATGTYLGTACKLLRKSGEEIN